MHKSHKELDLSELPNSLFLYFVKEKEYFNKTPFHPTEHYPEYPFSAWFEKTETHNHIYSAIREIFYRTQLDKEHRNTKEWNPLSQFIKPGDTVLLKPNLVLDAYISNPKRFEAVITHASIIRAVMDYVFIALKGKGTILIGDAPLQSANIENILEKAGIKEIIEFYHSQASPSMVVEFHDFRTETMKFERDKKNTFSQEIRTLVKLKGDPWGYSIIDVGEKSAHHGVDMNYKKYRVTDYNPSLMKNVHNTKNHKYLIANSVIKADVVIHLPKFKTHRKAGITCCLKNNIGINGHKDWLPHHKKGSIQEGGDEYLYYDPIKMIMTNIEEIEDRIFLKYPRLKKLRILTVKIRTLLRLLNEKTRKDPYYEGSWWGNNTLWRTILDLNRILYYADKEGKLQTDPQRKRLYFVDAVIAGEGEGPLKPKPYPLGIIAFGEDPVAIDRTLATLAGLDYKKIPSIYHPIKQKQMPITKLAYGEPFYVRSNNPNLNKKEIKNIIPIAHFVPTRGWKDHIELPIEET